MKKKGLTAGSAAALLLTAAVIAAFVWFLVRVRN